MTKEEYMDLALSVAEGTIGQTSPNPSVGAVVVKDGRILGIGSHLQPGKAHAEVYAIEQAGEEAEGAEIYVTLEPCAHFGQTPPCADLIIARKLSKVYIACLDPNPAVAGRGVKKLQQAGIEIEIGIREAKALELNRKFFHFIETRTPYVTLKAAMTLDGKTATSTGDSRWITSEAAREDVHKQRSIHDGILVGINTVIEDNPKLTTRLPQGGKNPIRIILDTHLKLFNYQNPLHVFEITDVPTWIVCGAEAGVRRDGVEQRYSHVHVIPLTSNTISTNELLVELGERGIQSLYVEGGNSVHGSFVETGLFNELHWYVAPKILGGKDAIPAVGGRSPHLMQEAESLDFIAIDHIGPDIKITARPRREQL